MANSFHGSGRSRGAGVRPVSMAALLALGALAGFVIAAARAQDPVPSSAQSSTLKTDARKAKVAYEEGNRAERQGDWPTAYTDYTDAANYAPANRDYVIRRDIAKSRVVQSKMDIAERDAISGRLDEAQKQLLSASFIDPLNPAIRKRLAELATAGVGPIRKKPEVELAGE